VRRGRQPHTAPVLRNVLAWNLDKLSNLTGGTLTAEHLTAHNCTNLMAETTGTVCFTNSILANVGAWQCATLHTNACAFLASDSGGVSALKAG
jgi:hypothetical protein